MCGRYAASRRPEDLAALFGVAEVEPAERLEPDYNVAPTKPVYAVLERPPRPAEPPAAGPAEGPPPEGPSAEAPPVRQLRTLTWGLVPSWAKDATIGSRLINARMETVDSKPAYRRAFARRRCLLPADGYYEWYAGEEAAPETAASGGRRAAKKPRKQPYFIHPADGGVLAMAGIYELWRDPSKPDGDEHAWRWTCSVLTTSAPDALGHIHDRMPLLVEPSRYDAWLDPSPRPADELRGLLVPAAPGRLAAYPVSTAVNSVRNNGPELLTPVTPAGVDVVTGEIAPATAADDRLF
jgi:putative SOS response-associated peptidase YedK